MVKIGLVLQKCEISQKCENVSSTQSNEKLSSEKWYSWAGEVIGLRDIVKLYSYCPFKGTQSLYFCLNQTEMAPQNQHFLSFSVLNKYTNYFSGVENWLFWDIKDAYFCLCSRIGHYPIFTKIHEWILDDIKLLFKFAQAWNFTQYFHLQIWWGKSIFNPDDVGHYLDSLELWGNEDKSMGLCITETDTSKNLVDIFSFHDFMNPGFKNYSVLFCLLL